MPHRRCWVEIDGRALRHNVKVIRGLIPRTTLLLAVVKANAYGHGLVPTAREFEALGVDWLGVANVAEGMSLRHGGVTRPILLLSATLPGEMADAVQHRLTLTLSSVEEARALALVARETGRAADAHFKIDTGMGRLGAWHKEAEGELRAVQAIKGVTISGLCTHFASADENAPMTRAQWRAVTPFFEAHPRLLCHAANSPAVTRGYGFHAGMVRAGLALYGVPPHPRCERLGLRPALTWKCRLGLVREMGAGRTVSYGATYRVPSKQRHGVVTMGYGDGYFRANGDGGHLLVGGQRCPIRGRVTMDQIIVDVTRVRHAKIGDEAVALGAQGGNAITARDLASRSGTIPWEILTNIGARVPRIYRHFQSEEERKLK
jgi:alanine racemase